MITSHDGPRQRISTSGQTCLSALRARAGVARTDRDAPPRLERDVLLGLVDDLGANQRLQWLAAIDDRLDANDPTFLRDLALRLLRESAVMITEPADAVPSGGPRLDPLLVGGLTVATVVLAALLGWWLMGSECERDEDCDRQGMICQDGRCTAGAARESETVPRFTADEGSRARAFYLSVIEDYNKGDRSAYLDGFSDPLECWYSRRKEPRSALAEARKMKWTAPKDKRATYRYAIERLRLVAAAGDRLGFLEEGRHVRPDGEKAYQRGVIVRQVTDKMWVLGEVNPNLADIEACVGVPANATHADEPPPGGR